MSGQSVSAFNDLVQFEALKPDKIIGLILDDDEFTIKNWIEGKKSTVLNADHNASVLDDMMIFIVAGAVFIVVLALLIVLACVLRKFKKKIIDKIKAIKKKFFWNGFVRALQISYLTQCMTVGSQFKLLLKGSDALTPTNTNVAAGMLGFLLLIIVVEFVFLYRNYETLHLPAMKEKYENLYANIGKSKKFAVVTNAPVFLLRRLFLASIPIMLIGVKGVQIQMLVFS
jgi:hypothetical protein